MGYQFSSSGKKIYAINYDGTIVNGFPININEKIQKGVSLFDFNGNGKDDMVFGTDNNNIYLIYDDGTVAEGGAITKLLGTAITIGTNGVDVAVTFDGQSNDGLLTWMDLVYTSWVGSI